MRSPLTVRVLLVGGVLRRVVLAYLLYGLVEVTIWLAIILWAYGYGGAPLAGLVSVVQLIPAALLAPPLAALGDRHSRGTALALAHLGVAVTTGGTAAALVLHAPGALVVLASTAATIALSVVRPLHFAVLPQLVAGPDDLVAANALSSIGDGTALFLGPMLAGLGAAVAGPALVFGFATAFAAMASLLCLRTHVPAPPVVGDGSVGWRNALAGFGSLARDRAVVVLLLVLTTKFLVEGAHDVLGVALSVDALHLGSSGAGAIVAAMGLGALLGGAGATAAGRRPRLAPVVLGSGLAQGIALALVAVLLALVPVVVLVVIAGAGGTVLLVAGRTLLQRTADERMLARVFAVQEATSLVGLAVGAAVAPALVDRLSPGNAFLPLGLGAAAVTTLGFWLVRRLDDRAELRPAETALLRRVPFLRLLPAYELEQLARSATWLACAPGEQVVREGDAGDLFYVVGEGELRVTVAGTPRPRTLVAGDSFGEIALLRAVPRTATVTAVRPGRLLAVGAAEFLAAVTGSPDGRALAAEVASAHLARDATAR
ncbi:MAG TPA: cyclic nucleotide-binding domain-containing protein [Marmoricola sp.]|nr:cyclic nucleotide-binding domain-containing protein [Marmoricola sp.]